VPFRLVRGNSFDPLVETVAGYAESGRDIGNGITALDDLPDGFFFEFGRILLNKSLRPGYPCIEP
jgi:hypothetical protein